MSQLLCRKCLIGVQAEQYADMIQKCTAAIPQRDRAGEAEFARRIALCEACEFFHAATCRACGCYVELRALKAATHCPKKKW